jgi:hypothetical protein
MTFMAFLICRKLTPAVKSVDINLGDFSLGVFEGWSLFGHRRFFEQFYSA